MVQKVRNDQNNSTRMNGYSQTNAEQYFRRTHALDTASFLKLFAEHLKAGCSILDVGCGAGRDLLWFKNRGLKVNGFERSELLAALARKKERYELLEGT